MEKVLVISKGNAPFVQQDISILRKSFKVKHFIFSNKSGISNIIYIIRLIRFLYKEGRSSQYMYFWFNDFHVSIAQIFGKLYHLKSIIVIGGYDAAKLPEIGYGLHLRSWKSHLAKISINNSYKTIAVSNFTKKNLLSNIDIIKDIQVVYNHIPSIGTSVISNYEKQYISTVCVATSKHRLLVKGLDRFIAIAQELPSESFKIIGTNLNILYQITDHIPSNIIIIDKQSYQDYLKELSSSKIIVQLSRYESFGISVFEAIQLGAIPLVAKQTGLSELINNDIFKVDATDKSAILSKLYHLLNTDCKKELKKLSQFIEENHSTEKRTKDLLNIFNYDK